MGEWSGVDGAGTLRIRIDHDPVPAEGAAVLHRTAVRAIIRHGAQLLMVHSASAGEDSSPAADSSRASPQRGPSPGRSQRSADARSRGSGPMSGELEFEPVWIGIDEATDANERVMAAGNAQTWVPRETAVLRALRDAR